MHTSRRTMIAGAAGVLAAPEAYAQSWWPFGRREQAQTTPAQHEGHGGDHGAGHGEHGGEHEGHGMHPSAPEAAFTGEEGAVVHALLHCAATGEACLTHCLSLLAEGDQSMAGCARAVREMLAVCEATRTLMQSRSSLVGAQLAVCRDACAACRAACQPHAGHHAQCAACAQSCAEAIAAIEALLA